AGYLDLGSLEELDPKAFVERRDHMEATAAASEGRDRDIARLRLAQYLVANRFAIEALGVLRVLESELKASDLTREIRSTAAIANVLAGRPHDALQLLNAARIDQEVDALFWRTIARAEVQDYRGARFDAMEARAIADSYPEWARNRFRLAAARAAVETEDTSLAQRLLDAIDFASISIEDNSLHHLLSGRI